MVVLGLYCCMGLSLAAAEWGLFSSCDAPDLVWWLLLLWSTQLLRLKGTQTSVVTEHGLSSCLAHRFSYSTACGGSFQIRDQTNVPSIGKQILFTTQPLKSPQITFFYFIPRSNYFSPLLKVESES